VHSSVLMRRVSPARDGDRLSAEALERSRAVPGGFARPLVACLMAPAGVVR